MKVWKRVGHFGTNAFESCSNCDHLSNRAARRVRSHSNQQKPGSFSQTPPEKRAIDRDCGFPPPLILGDAAVSADAHHPSLPVSIAALDEWTSPPAPPLPPLPPRWPRRAQVMRQEGSADSRSCASHPRECSMATADNCPRPVSSATSAAAYEASISPGI